MRVLCRVGMLALVMGFSAPALAQDYRGLTGIVDIGQGRGFSNAAKGLGEGGYELSGGEWVAFHDWYHSDYPEVEVLMLTQLSQDFGVLWGGATGERGPKYTIEPSVNLGFLMQAHPSPNSVLTLSVETTFAGYFSEKACEADYGALGGIQAVNCRLAASELPPAETLNYLASAWPEPFKLNIAFRASF